jgi:hypothetical protein
MPAYMLAGGFCHAQREMLRIAWHDGQLSRNELYQAGKGEIKRIKEGEEARRTA